MLGLGSCFFFVCLLLLLLSAFLGVAPVGSSGSDELEGPGVAASGSKHDYDLIDLTAYHMSKKNAITPISAKCKAKARRGSFCQSMRFFSMHCQRTQGITPCCPANGGACARSSYTA